NVIVVERFFLKRRGSNQNRPSELVHKAKASGPTTHVFMLGFGDVRHRESVAVNGRAPFFFRDENVSGRQIDSHRQGRSGKENSYFALGEISLYEIALFPGQIGVVDGYAFCEKRKEKILRVGLLERLEFLDRARRCGKLDHLFELFADRFRAELVRKKNNALL